MKPAWILQQACASNMLKTAKCAVRLNILHVSWDMSAGEYTISAELE